MPLDFNEVDIGKPLKPPEDHEPQEWKTRLAGVTFDGRQDNILEHARMNSKYRLVRDPENKHSKFAVKVLANGHDIGFLPEYLAKELAPRLDAGDKLRVHFRRKLVSEDQTKPVGLIIRIWEG